MFKVNNLTRRYFIIVISISVVSGNYFNCSIKCIQKKFFSEILGLHKAASGFLFLGFCFVDINCLCFTANLLAGSLSVSVDTVGNCGRAFKAEHNARSPRSSLHLVGAISGLRCSSAMMLLQYSCARDRRLLLCSAYPQNGCCLTIDRHRISCTRHGLFGAMVWSICIAVEFIIHSYFCCNCLFHVCVVFRFTYNSRNIRFTRVHNKVHVLADCIA